ncbi:MAG: hypothetical protein OEM15_08050 [Myxococcales bacterium]|nr:hypothetical protein [Myxococcales bacterium]MDH3484903.1 hypothetical protein [Myxococcales bacterium]
MNKLIYLLWPCRPMERAARRTTLLDRCAPALLDSGVRYLTMNIDDDFAKVPSPTPTTKLTNPFVAEVSVWIDQMGTASRVESILLDAGFDLAGYRVTEHLYTDYGGNQHSSPRDWPDGQRSPGIVSVTPLERPKRIAKDEWMRHWFRRQGPMSEAMQPRSRYVRNVVLDVLTPDAVPYEGIVEESWPSAEHMTDPMRFYGARSRLELLKNMAIMMHSVATFLPIWKITSVTTSEYFIRTPHS